MSRDVSMLDKFVRIVGFSLYLSFIVFFFFLFFKGFRFSLIVFLVSTVYFMLIFLALMLSNHIHFNVLLKRSQVKNALFTSVYPLKRFKILKIFSWVAIAMLLLMAGFYLYLKMPVHAATLILIAVFTYLYIHMNKIKVHVINEGIAFDYGQFIVLLQWKEIKKISVKGNHVVAELKEKHIKRKFYVEHPEKFKKIVNKLGFNV